MDKWIEIASKNGVNGVIALFLIAAAWFFYKKIWPILEKRLNDADVRDKDNAKLWKEQGEQFTAALQRERDDNARRFEDQGKMFMEALRTQNVLSAETHKDSMNSQNELIRSQKELAKSQGRIAEELRRVHEYLKNGNGK